MSPALMISCLPAKLEVLTDLKSTPPVISSSIAFLSADASIYLELLFVCHGHSFHCLCVRHCQCARAYDIITRAQLLELQPRGRGFWQIPFRCHLLQHHQSSLQLVDLDHQSCLARHSLLTIGDQLELLGSSNQFGAFLLRSFLWTQLLLGRAAAHTAWRVLPAATDAN